MTELERINAMKLVCDAWLKAMDNVIQAAKEYDAAREAYRNTVNVIGTLQAREAEVTIGLYVRKGSVTK